jgi:hypothetical protein
MTTDKSKNEHQVLFYEIQKQLKKAFRKKLCMAPSAMKNACTKKKKPNCHTISKGASLRKIAPDNHVYIISPNDDNFYKRIGINDATVFYGFCKKHDTEIFAPIENTTASISSLKQLFLLAYRALCLRLYKKRSNKLFLNSQPISEILPYKEAHHFGVDNAIDGLEFYKKQYDTILLTNNYSQLTTLLIKLDDTPPIMGTGFIFPDVDLAGNLVNDLGDPLTTPKGFAISCVGSPGGTIGIIALTATKNSNDLLHAYYNQMKDKSADEILEVVVKLMLLREENIVFSINWWDNLSENLKSTIKSMFFIHSSPMRSNDDVDKEIEFMSQHYGFFNDTRLSSIKLMDAS